MTRNFGIRTLDPRNPKADTIEVVIPGDLIERFYKEQVVRYENFRAVKTVLESPLRIFSGVRLLNQGGWCYVGRPEEWYIKENVTAPFPRNRLFAVYVNPNFRVYEFRAEETDVLDPDCPRNWEQRYGGLVWKRTS